MNGFLVIGRPDIDINPAVGVVSLGLRQRHQDELHHPLGAESAVGYRTAPYMQLAIDGCGGFG